MTDGSNYSCFIIRTLSLSLGTLRADTVSAWDEYVQNTDLRMQERLDGRLPFLWADEMANRRQRVDRGEIVVAPALKNGHRKVPNGPIHHWIGAIFIPGATVDRLVAVLENYSAYYEERDGGVQLELEALALSRDIPVMMRWLVNPCVNRLSINSMTTTLQQTRDAVNMRTTLCAPRPDRSAAAV